MIPQIPKRLLIHSAELITEFAPDKWGKAQKSETAVLERVRIDPSAKHIIGGNGETVQLSAVLFFDCRNSSPAGVTFALKDDTVNGKVVIKQKVNFDGRVFTVQTVEPLYANKKRIHHYEIGLV
ncbi:MAG: minor capsid protein [Prevotella sp.]|nr:minor capsid protein [Prevotella sp.]